MADRIAGACRQRQRDRLATLDQIIIGYVDSQRNGAVKIGACRDCDDKARSAAGRRIVAAKRRGAAGNGNGHADGTCGRARNTQSRDVGRRH